MENMNKDCQGNKNYCDFFYYTLDKVLLKVDLQSIRIKNNIEKVCPSQFKPSMENHFMTILEVLMYLTLVVGVIGWVLLWRNYKIIRWD